MSKDIIDAIQASGANVMITMSADELRDFAADIAHSVAEQMSALTINSIKVVMGDTINLCTMDEAVRDFKIKKPTLNSWIAKGLIIPLKKGRKNMFQREDLVRLTRKRIG